MLPLSGGRRLCNYNGVPVVWDLGGGGGQRDERWHWRQPQNKHVPTCWREERLPGWNRESQNCLRLTGEASPPPGHTGWGRGRLSGCRRESWRSPGFPSGEGPWWWCELDLRANTHQCCILTKTQVTISKRSTVYGKRQLLETKQEQKSRLVPASASMEASSLQTMDPLFLILHCLL